MNAIETHRASSPLRLYRLAPAQPTNDRLPRWAQHFPAHTEVIGYSSLGHFFVRNPADLDYAVLHPYKGAMKSYGSHASVEAFETEVLLAAGFEEYVLRPQHVQLVADRLGPLEDNKIYIPAPYPMLGGSDAPETYDKGDVWVWADIVAQTLGL